MPIATIADLFEVGAQNSITQSIENGVTEIQDFIDVLRRRFGGELTVPSNDIAAFVGRVQDAIRAADLINQGEIPLTGEIPEVAGLPSAYSYQLIISVPDPEDPGNVSRRVSIPFTLPAAEPLSIEQIRERVDEMLPNWDPPRDTMPGGPAADLIRRDVLIRGRVSDFGGDITGLSDVGVIAVYRRG